MNKYEIIQKIENFAPLDTQESWDSSGWIVDLDTSEISKIMYALTITKDVFNQALKKGCDMIISHHPLFEVPLEYKKINMYCAHTNLDKAKGGTTDLILEKLRFKGCEYGEFVRIVDFETSIDVEELREKLLKISPNLRYVNNSGAKSVRRVGFCAGSGSEFIESSPCDAFVTGDLKYHTACETEKVIFDIGHFESEIFAKELLMKICGIKGVFADEKSPFI